MRFIFAILLFISLPAYARQSLHLVFLHVNDVHGQTRGISDNGRTVGSYARLATLVRQIRSDTSVDKVFLVHAGDEFSKGDDLTAKSLGAANIQIMNALGFDLFVPGNGDYYPGLPNLRKRLNEFNGKAVTANIFNRFTSQLILPAYVIEPVDDLRIGIFGLGELRENHPSVLAMRTEEPLDAAVGIVNELKTRSDLIVAITHIGIGADRVIARDVEGISLIIGGHSHTVLPHGEWVNSRAGGKTLIAHAGDYLKYLGRVDLHLEKDGDTWEIIKCTSQLIPVDVRYAPDESITTLIDQLLQQYRPATEPASPPHR